MLYKKAGHIILYPPNTENRPKSYTNLVKSQVNITYEKKVLALHLFTKDKHNIIFPTSHMNNPKSGWNSQPLISVSVLFMNIYIHPIHRSSGTTKTLFLWSFHVTHC